MSESDPCHAAGMRLTQFRIYAVECADGQISLALMKVYYEGGKVKGQDLVLNDWCEPGQLEAIVGQFVGELAAEVYRRAAEANPVLPF